MTPETIIEKAQADGVSLALSTTGTIKASGDGATVTRWLPIIREQKPAIVKALLEANACTGDLAAIQAWLTFIGESDPTIITDVLKQCQRDADARDYFTGRAAAELPTPADNFQPTRR